VVLEDEPPLVSDRDPVELTPLDTYELGARLYERLAAGSSEAEAASWARGLGLVPPGTPGDVDVQRVMEIARRLFAEAKEWLAEEAYPPLAVDVSLDGIRLVGILRDVRPRGQAFVRFARLKPKNELSAWVRHLALCAVTEGTGRSTLVLGRAMDDEAYTEGRVFSPVEPRRARAFLADLARLHRLGQRAPLSLFPTASKIYAQKLAEGPGRERSAMFFARNAFRDRKAGAEAGDVYVRRAFANGEPLAPEPAPLDDEPGTSLPSFAEASVLVFGPLLSASKAVSA
jgi:exodeoxyribonuclease V gamma subunit